MNAIGSGNTGFDFLSQRLRKVSHGRGIEKPDLTPLTIRVR
jgi:hypothetical protein